MRMEPRRSWSYAGAESRPDSSFSLLYTPSSLGYGCCLESTDSDIVKILLCAALGKDRTNIKVEDREVADFADLHVGRTGLLRTGLLKTL